jgi:uncharacterized membrane-anchored protein YhcB (DUF1043 family)
MKNIRRRKLWIVLISVLVVCLVIGTVTLLVQNRREQTLEEQQNETLKELYDNQGRYDEHSIVLSNTTKPASSNLKRTDVALFGIVPGTHPYAF